MSAADDPLAPAAGPLRVGRPDLAEQTLRALLASDPRCAPAWHLLGSLAYQSGRPALAADCFRKAADADPHGPLYHSCLGAALLALGRPAEAADAFRQAADVAPADPAGRKGLARALMALNRHAEGAYADGTTAELRKLARHWHPTTGLSDELAALIRQDGIDVLVDRAGDTAGNRLLAFARQPAPVQLSYLGYPGTTGLFFLVDP